MKPRRMVGADVRKEIHLVLPAWLLGVALPLASLGLFQGEVGRFGAAMLGVLGCALIGSSAFGPEFSHGTMGLLLAQPIERRRIWWRKMAVLGAALAPFLGAAVLVGRLRGNEEETRWLVFAPLCAFCATPALTLWMRGGLGAAVLTVALPLLLCGLTIGVFAQLHGPDRLLPQVADFDRTLVRACLAILAAYCVGAVWLGYRKFLRLQDAGAGTRELSLAGFVEAPCAGILHRLSGRRNAFASLVRKEIRLQHTAVLLAVVFVVVFAVLIAFLPSLSESARSVALILPVVLLGGLIPVVMGAVAVAEERNLGLHAWQLTLPVPPWQPWLAKSLVIFGGSFLLGVVLPWACVLAAFARLDDMPSAVPDDLFVVLIPVFVQALVTAFILYASTLFSTTLRAVVGGIGLAAGAGLSAFLLGRVIVDSPVWIDLASPGYEFMGWHLLPGVTLWEIVWLGVLGFPILVLQGLAYGNFRTADISRRRVWAQSALVLGPVVALALLLPGLAARVLRVLGDVWGAL